MITPPVPRDCVTQGEVTPAMRQWMGRLANFMANILSGVQVDANRNTALGAGVLATNATDGFAYIPTCAGVPTGTPTAIAGFLPMVIDSSANKAYIYSGGAWRILN